MILTEAGILNYLLECVFRNRKYPDGFLDDINTKPHGFPKDTDKLCAILKYYHDTQGLIVLLTDFDNDGIMCGVEGFAGLAELGFNVALFIPDVTEGYGFDEDTIDTLVAQYPDVKAILTADVGITCYGGVKHARDLNIDVLVTDHHLPKGRIAANVFVDPTREDETSGYSGICGAAVLYNVLLYYAEHYSGSPYLVSQIRRLCVFAGCGTISDNMPVYYENRDLIRDAIDIFTLIYSDGKQDMVNSLQGCDIYRRAFLGLFILMNAFKERGNVAFSSIPINLHEDFVGYYLAPAFNSIKRMGADMHKVYGVFFGPQPKIDMEEVLDLNEMRKELVEEKFADIIDEKFIQPWKPYIYVTDAYPGLCGLLAQKVMLITGEPVMVVTINEEGKYVGSGRSPHWYPFLNVAVSNKWYAAGHNPAFGIGFDNEIGGDALFDFLTKTVGELKPDDEEMVTTPDFVISMFDDGDASIDVELLSDYLDELSSCRPFGEGFPEPEALLKVNTRMVEFSVMGKQKNHLRIKLPMGISAVCWNQADMIKNHGTCIVPDKDDESHMYPYWLATDLPECLELWGKFAYNDYNGTRSIQFIGTVLNGPDDEVGGM